MQKIVPPGLEPAGDNETPEHHKCFFHDIGRPGRVVPQKPPWNGQAIEASTDVRRDPHRRTTNHHPTAAAWSVHYYNNGPKHVGYKRPTCPLSKCGVPPAFHVLETRSSEKAGFKLADAHLQTW